MTGLRGPVLLRSGISGAGLGGRARAPARRAQELDEGETPPRKETGQMACRAEVAKRNLKTVKTLPKFCRFRPLFIYDKLLPYNMLGSGPDLVRIVGRNRRSLGHPQAAGRKTRDATGSDQASSGWLACCRRAARNATMGETNQPERTDTSPAERTIQTQSWIVLGIIALPGVVGLTMWATGEATAWEAALATTGGAAGLTPTYRWMLRLLVGWPP